MFHSRSRLLSAVAVVVLAACSGAGGSGKAEVGSTTGDIGDARPVEDRSASTEIVFDVLKDQPSGVPQCKEGQIPKGWCCCVDGNIAKPECVDNMWQCPSGFGLYTGEICQGACPGPCPNYCPDIGADDAVADIGTDTQTDGFEEADVPSSHYTDISFIAVVQGGFMGAYAKHVVADDYLTAFGWGDEPTGCEGPLPADQIDALLWGAQWVDWPTLKPFFYPTEAPTCGFDMFEYALEVTLTSEDGIESWSTGWCDVVVFPNLIPVALKDFAETVDDAIHAVAKTCPDN